MRMIKGVLLTLIFIITGCKEDALLNGLNQNQANEVVALLLKNNIDASKINIDKSGYSVYVARRDFSTAVDLITIYNFPSKPRVEIAEMFPADALISSPRAEVARIYSAIEQRLEQTLNQIKGIVSSRVHVSYDISNVDAEKKGRPVHISVLLRYDSAYIASENLIFDATRLVKNSFSNVEYDNISVVMTPAPEVWQLPPVQVQQYNSQYGVLIAITVAILLLITVFFFADKRRLINKK
ncbi:type III secretion inner membrane ring lipoprotein SctJ [Erwiniaceae bacterium BAC15a-03b]|uniref:Lipoprotein n=1 Tax=Winslowiella arboricola TaxID=2978220 RepID=A0A9J6PSE4_9GAMM|nr:type III secretion inner membrane ring lipoprotein SctJ [Winslowiella arboricola]MCU5773750.1 type III secretion inner membrane ring lipoprotein SctJ [Winslowiella arboricola]MCU5777660.1 type III secretion inner membrane ring lipoprotein SctJ [Winslowiella arboricola]